MNSIRMVATVSCALLFSMVLCDSAAAQTRMTLSQYRAAQARAAQQAAQRAAQQRSYQQRSVFRPTVRSAPSRYVPVETPATQERIEAPKVFTDKVPEAALLTDRGTELTERLRSLRYTEASLGAKHPSMEDVREQIVSIKRELKAWAPNGGDDREATESKDGASDDSKETLATLNESDLRQLVIRLSVDVSTLRQRVAELEAAQEKMSSQLKDAVESK